MGSINEHSHNSPVEAVRHIHDAAATRPFRELYARGGFGGSGGLGASGGLRGSGGLGGLGGLG